MLLSDVLDLLGAHLLGKLGLGEERSYGRRVLGFHTEVTSLTLNTCLPIVLILVIGVKVLLDIVDHLAIRVVIVGLIWVPHLLTSGDLSRIIRLTVLASLEDENLHIRFCVIGDHR